MATPLLDASVAGVASNSYCTVQEANDYHSARLFSSTWTAAATSEKTISLIMATRTIDAQMIWAGSVWTDTQALMWPRYGVYKKNQSQWIPNDEIPVELKWATAEFARQLLAVDRTLDSDVETQGIKSLDAGPISLVFRDDVKAKVVPDAVVNLIPAWWGRWRGAKASTGTLVRT